MKYLQDTIKENLQGTASLVIYSSYQTGRKPLEEDLLYSGLASTSIELAQNLIKDELISIENRYGAGGNSKPRILEEFRSYHGINWETARKLLPKVTGLHKGEITLEYFDDILLEKKPEMVII